MDQSQSTSGRSERVNERGAALVIALLIATVLLVAGGALIQVTSMSAANAIDSTAETQAYYGAEAGLQAALNALRGNAAHSATAMPAGMTRINFRNAVDKPSSNDCPAGVGGDPSADARLSRWLPYTNRQTANTRVTVGANPTIEYDVVVSIPIGDPPLSPPPSTVEPSRLLIRATGYGPNGAIKQMNMMISRNAFDPSVPATMTLIGTPGGNPAMSFESGNSAKHVYSSVDQATGLPTGFPAFGTTNAGDATIATTQAASNTTSTPAAGVLTSASIPEYLRSPGAAVNFLNLMRAAATTYLPNGGSGNPQGITFCNGNYTMGSGSGSGILVVTGELITHGGTSFNGLLYVIGAGYINRDGGGGGAFYGANFVARVEWPAGATPLSWPTNATPLANFGAPFFNFNGAGNATMQYDSSAVANALQLLPASVLGVSEY